MATLDSSVQDIIDTDQHAHAHSSDMMRDFLLEQKDASGNKLFTIDHYDAHGVTTAHHVGTTPAGSTSTLKYFFASEDSTAALKGDKTSNSVIFGNEGDNKITGGGGQNVIYAGGGNDTIKAGSKGDNIDGGDGNDKITGGAGNDVIYGGKGNDTITGGGGTNILYGGEGNDKITGGTSSDNIYGGTGNDTLTGGKGNDIFHYGSAVDEFGNKLANGSGNDTITDFGKYKDIDKIYVGKDAVYDANGQKVIEAGSDDLVVSKIEASGKNTIVTLSDGSTITLKGVTTDHLTETSDHHEIDWKA